MLKVSKILKASDLTDADVLAIKLSNGVLTQVKQ